MSHETASWTVEQNRLLEERAKQAAWQQADECEREVQALNQKVSAAQRQHGASLTGLNTRCPLRPAATSSRVQVEAFVRDMKAYARESSSQLSASIAALDIGARLARLAPVVKGETATKAKTIEERQEIAARVITRLPGDLAETDRQAIDKLAGIFLREADAGYAKNAEMALRERIQCAQEGSKQRERNSFEAVQWKARLLGLEGKEVLWANAELTQVESGTKRLDASLVQRLGQIEAKAKKDVDKQHATQVIKDAFVALGYQVDEEFDTAFSEGGVVTMQHPGLDEYAVELEIPVSGNQFHAHLVRESVDGLDPAGAADYRQQRDSQHEAKLCVDLRQARKEMLKSGVKVEIQARIAPGTPDAVKVVAPRRRNRSKSGAHVAARPIKH